MNYDAPYVLDDAAADAINALLPTCKYVAGILCNESGEVRFCAQQTEWIEDDHCSLGWWSTGNMSCDCNRELQFRQSIGEDPELDDVKCGDERYTLVGIWFPDGSDLRDLHLLNDL